MNASRPISAILVPKLCLETRCPATPNKSLAWLLVSLVIATMGCSEADGIRSYTVKRIEPTAKPAVASRMLAAIVPHGEMAWFFKLTGPDVATESQTATFESLIKSLHFADGPSGDPQWTLPSGWTQKPGTAMRFATLEVEANGETLECSVSQLPRADQPWEDYLLANINRWRGQLRLPAITSADLPKQSSIVKLTDSDTEATLINIVGESAGGGMPAAPFASGRSRAPFAENAPPQPSAVSAPKISHKAPSSWTAGELEISRGGIVVQREAAFEIKDGDKRAEVTVTKLPAGRGAASPQCESLARTDRSRRYLGRTIRQRKETVGVGGNAGRLRAVLGQRTRHFGCDCPA